MSYRIEQQSEYAGGDRWKWSVWVEADGEDHSLEQLTEVIWILHPSFARSRVSRADHATKFRLNESGWGAFLVRAELRMKSGQRRELSQHLRLEYPDEANTPRFRGIHSASKGKVPKVFLSYSAADKRMAEEIRSQLTSIGTQVLDVNLIEPGELWSSSLDQMIRQADAVVGVVGVDEASPSVIREMQQAKLSGKPVMTLVDQRNSSPGLHSDQKSVQMFFEHGKAQPIGNLVHEWLKSS